MLGPIDVEGEVVTLLNAALTPTVSTRIPNPRPASHVRVTRAGGQGRSLVQSDVRLLVECWGPDSTEAFDLARLAYAHLWATYGDASTWGGAASLTEPVNFPDPDTDSPRYQFLATITTSLTEVTA